MGSLYRRKPGGVWHGSYHTRDGRRRRSTGTKHKQDAQRILAKWESDELAVRHGLTIAPSTSLESLLAEYLAWMRCGESHRADAEKQIRRIVDACGFRTVADIRRVQVESVVQKLPSKLEPTATISTQTQRHYLAAFKAFCRWLTELRHACDRNPMLGTRSPTATADRRRIRRFLLPDEWPWLARTEHALLYETAIMTGLRARELRQLRPQHVHADHILLPAEFAKNRKRAKQYITPELSAHLRDALPFDLPDKYHLNRTWLQPDLVAARAAWKKAGNTSPTDFLEPINASGHVLDFHSLRHTCGAWLALDGINVKLIQSIMRHSTITLTLDTYGHLLPDAEADAILALARRLAV